MKPDRWQELLHALQQVDDVDRAVDACLALAEEAGQEDLDRLFSLLDSEDFFLRECAAAPIARLVGAQALLDLLKAFTRGRAEGHDNDGLSSILIGIFVDQPLRSRDILSDLFSSADPRDRQNAAWGWGFLEETVGAEPLLAALGDAVPGVRTAAAGSLGSFQGQTRVVEALMGCLEDAAGAVRAAAASALGWLGDPRAIPALQSALKDPEDRVQDRARCALDRITQSPK